MLLKKSLKQLIVQYTEMPVGHGKKSGFTFFEVEKSHLRSKKATLGHTVSLKIRKNPRKLAFLQYMPLYYGNRPEKL